MAPRKTGMKEFYPEKKNKSKNPKESAGKGRSRGGKRQLDKKLATCDAGTLGSESAQPAVSIAHGSGLESDTEEILRQFDLNLSYGPCLGVTRLERWERASKFGLNPPEEVEKILRNARGNPDCLWEGHV